MSLFGKKLTPQEQVRKWKGALRTETRHIDREINALRREREKVKAELRLMAKRGERQAATILARSFVKSDKQINRLLEAQAQINSVSMQLDVTLAQVKAFGHMQKSTEILQQLHGLLSVQQVSETMRDLSREMSKAGLIQEMADDAFSIMDQDVEEEADEEVDKVMFEVTNGLLGSLPDIEKKQEEPEQKEDEDLEDIRARRAALLNE